MQEGSLECLRLSFDPHKQKLRCMYVGLNLYVQAERAHGCQRYQKIVVTNRRGNGQRKIWLWIARLVSRAQNADSAVPPYSYLARGLSDTSPRWLHNLKSNQNVQLSRCKAMAPSPEDPDKQGLADNDEQGKEAMKQTERRHVFRL